MTGMYCERHGQDVGRCVDAFIRNVMSREERDRCTDRRLLVEAECERALRGLV